MAEAVQYLRAWAADESGASLVEYMMLTSLIAVVCVAAVTLLGKAVQSKLDAPRRALAS
jgi:Flp pilus assembly pilin Flp